MGEFDAGFWFGPMLSAIHKAPPSGAKVIVVVQRLFLPSDKVGYSIPNGAAAFFPEIEWPDTSPPTKVRPCLVEVTGFDDPKVTETIENLGKLRGKQREQAEKQAAAEKKDAEAKSTSNAPAAK